MSRKILRNYALLMGVSLLGIQSAVFAQDDAAAKALSQQAPKKDAIAAKVNGKAITMADVQKELSKFPPQLQQAPFDKIYPRLIEEIVDKQLFLDASKKSKLGDSPEAKKMLEAARESIVLRLYVMHKFKGRATEAAIAARYKRFVAEFPKEKEVRVRQIQVKEEKAATEIIAELNKGGDFVKIAKERSIDSFAKEGGDIGYFKRGDMIPPIAEVAFNTKPGTFTQSPVKTDFGYHVIKVEDIRDAVPPTLEVAHDEIGAQILQEAMAEERNKLRAQNKVEIFDLSGAPVQAQKETNKAEAPAAK